MKCPICGNVLQFTLILPIGKKEKIGGYWCSYCGLTQDYKHHTVKTEESLQILQKTRNPQNKTEQKDK